MFIFLQLLGDVTLGIYEGLLSYPLRGHYILVCVAHLEIISEDIVEADLERRNTCALDLPLLHLEQVVLSVAGNLPEFIELFIDAACYNIALAKSYRRLGMHCPA